MSIPHEHRPLDGQAAAERGDSSASGERGSPVSSVGMCGIAGIVAWNENYRVSRDLLLKMSASIAHRGPDGEGIFLTREHDPITPDMPQAGFAFRRLAILDPDPRAMQPFTIGHQTIVFNGEIYNFRELRSELSKLRPDYSWRTTGDTEVLLMSYAQWGEKCLEKLNGMFALAVWDEREKSVFLARDRMGQKPLYVATAYCAPHPPAIAFASELAALRQLPWFDSRIDDAAVREYLRWGAIGNETTIYSQVDRVAQGLYLLVSYAKPFGGEYYFDPNGSIDQIAASYTSQAPDSTASATTRALVTKAVERQLISDVPLGVFLSGGVDSSIVALCARRFGTVATFSIGFDDPRYDESRYAREVAAHLKTDHHEFRVTPNVIDDLAKLAAVFGEPFADSSAIPTHYLARETRKQVTVALSGDGGDELFGGYDRYRAMRLERIIRRVPRVMRSTLCGPIFEQLPERHPKSVASRVKRFLRSVDQPPARRYASYLEIFDPQLIGELLQCDSGETASDFENLFEQSFVDRDAVQAALAVDRITYLPDDLLTKVDRCSMMHGLEVRSPFMDHELVRFAAGLTSDQLLKGGPKRMLREAFAEDLPDFVFKRKKMGFAVPIGEWFRDSLRPMLHDHLFASNSFARQHFHMPVVQRLVDEHEQFRADHAQRLYALLMLELWQKWSVASG